MLNEQVPAPAPPVKHSLGVIVALLHRSEWFKSLEDSLPPGSKYHQNIFKKRNMNFVAFASQPVDGRERLHLHATTIYEYFMIVYGEICLF